MTNTQQGKLLHPTVNMAAASLVTFMYCCLAYFITLIFQNVRVSLTKISFP